MGEFFDLLTQCSVCAFANAGRAVRATTSYGDQDVLLCPGALAIGFLQLLEPNLELLRTMLKCIGRLGKLGIGPLSKPDQIVLGADVGIVMSAEAQPCEEPLQFHQMIGIVRT